MIGERVGVNMAEDYSLFVSAPCVLAAVSCLPTKEDTPLQ